MTETDTTQYVNVEIELDDDLMQTAERMSNIEGLTLEDFLVKILTEYVESLPTQTGDKLNYE